MVSLQWLDIWFLGQGRNWTTPVKTHMVQYLKIGKALSEDMEFSETVTAANVSSLLDIETAGNPAQWTIIVSDSITPVMFNNVSGIAVPTVSVTYSIMTVVLMVELGLGLDWEG